MRFRAAGNASLTRMPFQFSLESVLRLRRSEQRQQELILQRMTDQLNRAANEVAAIKDEMRQVLGEKAAGSSHGAELYFEQERLRVLKSWEAASEEKFKRAREQHAFAVREFHRIWQKRESLESLQEREREAHIRHAEKKEQQRQDDLFLQRAQRVRFYPRRTGRDCLR